MDQTSRASQPKEDIFISAVTSARKKYSEIGDRQLPADIRQKYQQVFNKLYITKPNESSLSDEKEPYAQLDHKVIGLTYGDAIYEFDTSVSGATSGGHYHNKINPAKGELLAVYNVRDDTEKGMESALPGSEIQYQQIRLAEAFYKHDHMGFALRLTRVTRLGIINPTSRAVFQKIVDNNENLVFGKDKDEFYAILSTPNGLSSLFLLKDHGVDLGIHDIDRIQLFTETEAGKGLKVTFSIFFS